jgi:DNA invertase Pin-like site-specific DNA recombinase
MPRKTTSDTAARTVALCYLRKSVVRGDAEYGSVEQQRAAVAKIVEERGWRAEWYEDAEGHRSGRKEKGRPRWLALRTRIGDADVAAVVAHRMERLSRSVRDFGDLIEFCARHNVALITADRMIDTGSVNNAYTTVQSNVLMSLAQFESDIASQRMKERVAYKDSLGINHGKPPFGMTRSGEGNEARFTGNADAPAVVRCLELYAGGMSYDAAAERLNRDAVGFRARSGGVTRWGRESVRTVAGNVLRYAGFHIPQDGYDAKANRVELAGDGDHCDRWASKLGAWVSPAVEPIITRQLANAVIERRHRNQLAGKPATQPFILSPIAHWQGRKLVGDGRLNGTRFYRTRQSGVSIDANKAEAHAIAKLSELTIPPELRDGVRMSLLGRMSDARMDAIRQRADEAERKKAVLLDLHLDGRIDRDAYNKRYDEAERELRMARAELSAPAEVERAMDQLSGMAAMLATSSPERRKRVVLGTFERIELNEDGEIVAADWKPWARYIWIELQMLRGGYYAEGGNSGQHIHRLPAGIVWAINLPATKDHRPALLITPRDR